MTGSPTRVQSPARRRPLLRSKSAAPKRKHHPDGWCFLFGASSGIRTPDTLLKRQVLYLLSYWGGWLGWRDSNPLYRSQSPVCYHYTTSQDFYFKEAGAAGLLSMGWDMGLEPTTPWLTAKRSTLLSYAPIFLYGQNPSPSNCIQPKPYAKWSIRESNPPPPACKTGVAPLRLMPRIRRQPSCRHI